MITPNVFFCVSLQVTVNSMSAFFMPPDDLQLDELTNATLMKLEQFRDRTATGQLLIHKQRSVVRWGSIFCLVSIWRANVYIPQSLFSQGHLNFFTYCTYTQPARLSHWVTMITFFLFNFLTSDCFLRLLVEGSSYFFS